MEITRNKESLLKICRGGVTQWEKPRAEIELDHLFIGSATVNGIAYPKKSTVKVKVFRGQETIYEKSIDKVFFDFVISIPTLENRDKVLVTVSSPDYLTATFKQTVR